MTELSASPWIEASREGSALKKFNPVTPGSIFKEALTLSEDGEFMVPSPAKETPELNHRGLWKKVQGAPEVRVVFGSREKEVVDGKGEAWVRVPVSHPEVRAVDKPEASVNGHDGRGALVELEFGTQGPHEDPVLLGG